MPLYIRSLFTLLLLAVCPLANAQQDEGDPLAPDPLAVMIPTDSLIDIQLISRDTAILDYYALYAFEYLYNGKQKVRGEIMIPKKTDIYRHKMSARVKLCTVTHFINSWQGIEGKPMEVGEYMEITYDNGRKKHFFNFDPTVPNTVYTICNNKTQASE